MNPIAKATASTKKFVVRHKVAVTAAATATVCLALNARSNAIFNDFLKEKDLYDEFYAPENSY